MKNIFTKSLIAGLGCGVVLTSAHGTLVPSAASMDRTTFSAKVHTELHIHDEPGNTHKPLSSHYLDPKSLRRVRSEGDKIAENDRDVNGWDAYNDWVGISC